MNRFPQIFIQNIGQLITIAGAFQKPKTSRGMDDIGIIRNGAVFIQDGNFHHVGITIAEIKTGYGLDSELRILKIIHHL